MTEGERIRLYNDLCDYEQDLKMITYPSQAKLIDIVCRAIIAVKGVTSSWSKKDATPVFTVDQKISHYFNCTCNHCGFAEGKSTFRFCPSCGARMK